MCLVVSNSVTPWTVAHQAPVSMGFPGKYTGVGCHFLLEDLPDPGIEPMSVALQVVSSVALQTVSSVAGRFFTAEPPGKPY